MYNEDKELFKIILKCVAASVVATACFIGACSSCEVVPPGHRGLVIHAGQVQDGVLGEGLVFKWPVYTNITSISIRIRQALTDTAAASKDMQKVHTKLSINWRIAPDKVKDVFQTLGNPDQIEDTIIDRTVSEVLKAATATMTAEEILVKRIQLKKMIDDELEKRLQTFGLVIEAVNLADFNFEPDFNKAVEEKQIAEQRAKKAVYDAQRATQEALAAVETAKGQAEAQRLLKSTITEDLIQKLAIEKWDGKLPGVMLSRDGLPFIQVGGAR